MTRRCCAPTSRRAAKPGSITGILPPPMAVRCCCRRQTADVIGPDVALVDLEEHRFAGLEPAQVRSIRRLASRPWWESGATMSVMAVRKLSVALDESVAQEAASAAARHGLSLSAWLNAAAERALVLENGLAGVRAWEADHGELTHKELVWADAIIDGGRDRVAS